MNSRAFIAFLVVLIVVIVAGWFILIHPSAQAPTATTTATTTVATTPVVQDEPSTMPSNPATVAANIAGNWQSTDDSNYTVQITSGGKWTDTYKGSDSTGASLSGNYTLFTSTNPDKNFTGVLVPGVVYVKVVEGSSTLYFSVLAASGNVLQLSYLDRGNTLSFVKVQ